MKSTINKSEIHITISSPHQLVTNPNKKLFLAFCRFEKSTHGESIDKLVNDLTKDGFDKNMLNEYLYEIGYHKGKKERKTTYKLLDMLMFEVDDKFPKLTSMEFKGNQLPTRSNSLYLHYRFK